MRKHTTPRGIRNNNPLNLRRTNSQWVGLLTRNDLSSKEYDEYFCQFRQMRYGWRAAFVNLCVNYYIVRGINTVEDIIMRWAPPSDGNNTRAYIREVCDRLGYKPRQLVPHPKNDAGFWIDMALAMAHVENGRDEDFDIDEILVGWELFEKYAKKLKYIT